MSHELGPWMTKERRTVKGNTGNNPQIAEARKLVRQNNYPEALAIYSGIYEQDGTVSAGYNTSIFENKLARSIGRGLECLSFTSSSHCCL
jgi:hypothetical protein